MDMSEYIASVTGQMRCKRARDMVAKELVSHMEEQKQAYIDEGMDIVLAEQEAVRQMGDAVEVGMEMDRIHRPKIDKKTLILIGILSVAAIFLQTIVLQAQQNAGWLFGSKKLIPLQVLIGVLLMAGILFVDYTFVGKYALKIWIALMIMPLILEEIRTNIWIMNIHISNSRIWQYVLFALFLPAYAGVIYYYRKKGFLGILYSVGWLGLASYLYCTILTGRIFYCLTMFVCGILLLSYAVIKGCYGEKKKEYLIVLWIILAVVVIGMVYYVLTYGLAYQADRMKAILGIGELDESEFNYMTYKIKEVMSELRLLGRGGDISQMPVESAMAFVIILNKLGIIPGVLLLAGILILLVYMAAGVSKQKNLLGSLVGTASILGLFFPMVLHLLSNIGVINYADMYMPFAYPGWLINASCYTLLGFYLSVYRNTDIVG